MLEQKVAPLFPKVCPKNSHSNSYLKLTVFNVAQKSHQIFGILLLENLLPKLTYIVTLVLPQYLLREM